METQKKFLANLNSNGVLSFILILSLVLLISQNKTYAQVEPNYISPGGLLDTVFDKDGNKYSLNDITIPLDSSGQANHSMLVNCNAAGSYFNVFFDNGWEGSTGNATQKSAVICQVLEDLSAFISSPLTGANKVNIWVRKIDDFIGTSGANSNVLGTASSFYTTPYNANAGFGGIVDNEIWKTIQGGKDSYTNVCAPLTNASMGNHYHGTMGFNFDNPSINWNYDLTSPTLPPPNDLLDLYSVVLHEMTHALGFTSLINYDGTSVFGTGRNYYSRYDLFLKDKSGTNLISNSPNSCSLYDYQFNTLTDFLTPNCTLLGNPVNNSGIPIDNTICSDAILYGSNNIPVYTPSCFEEGSSLSHFEDICYPTANTPANNDNYFTMSNIQKNVIVGNSFPKRHLTPEERLVLCDLGYQTANSFGSTTNNNFYQYTTPACTGINVEGINDGISGTIFTYFAQVGHQFSTSIASVLSNDYFSTTIPTDHSLECFEKVSGLATGAISGLFINFSSPSVGVSLFRYIPVDLATNKRGNITYIYFFATPDGNQATCNYSPCNLVPNGDFETLKNVLNMPDDRSQLDRTSCWLSANQGTPDYFHINANAAVGFFEVFVPCNFAGYQDVNITGKAYAGIIRNDDNLSQANELIYATLSQPLSPSTDYQFTMDASLAEFYSYHDYNLQICITDQLANMNNNGPYQMKLTDIHLPAPGSPIIISDYNIWTPVTINFRTPDNLGSSYNTLIIGDIDNTFGNAHTPQSTFPAGITCTPPSIAIPNISTQSYVYLDNITLRPASSMAAFNPPPSMPINGSLTLSNFVSPPTAGNFSINGVNYGSIGLFNPTIAGPYNATFTYTSGGCTYDLSATIYVNGNPYAGHCVDNPAVEINSPINITNAPTVHNGDIIYVKQGKLTINHNTSWTNCRVYFEKGARIEILPNIDFTLNQCHLEGCETFWDGIFLIGTNSKIILNSSIIENAIVGISCNNTSRLTVKNSVFNKNNTDIFIYGNNSNNKFLNNYIRGSVFTCRDLPHPSGALNMFNFASVLRGTDNSSNINSYKKSSLLYLPTPNNPSLRSDVGINISSFGTSSITPDYNITIGDKTKDYVTYGNLFDNHNSGIEVYKSNVEIVNNQFNDMAGYTKTNGTTTGIGIWAHNYINSGIYSIKIGEPIGGNALNTFINCGTGAFLSNYTNAIVSSNVFLKNMGSNAVPQGYYGRHAVRIANSLNSYYECNSNKIFNNYNGIEWAQNSRNKTFQCNFNYNEISTSSIADDCLNAIFLHGQNQIENTPNGFINVESNKIQNVFNGIRVQNFFDFGSLRISSGSKEILLRKSFFPQFGINVLNCNNAFVVDNNSIHSNALNSPDYDNITGISLSNCINPVVDCNTIYDIGTSTSFGINCTSSSLEGIMHNNNFTNYNIGVEIKFGTLFQDQGSPTYANDNQWHNSGSHYDFRNFNSQHWNFYVRNLNGYPYEPSAFLPPSSITIPILPSNQPSQSICGLNSSTTLPSNIMSIDQLINIRKFASGEFSFPAASNQFRWLLASTIFDQVLKDSLNSQNDSIIGNFRDSIQNTNIGNFHIVDSLISQMNWSQAGLINQSIIFNNHIEENLKKFNSYYIEYNNDTALTEDSTWLSIMINELSSVARECYITGGPAVPSSRTMLSYFTNELFEENNNCYKNSTIAIIVDTTISNCSKLKKYSVPLTSGATYIWSIPNGTSYTQNNNIIELNWGNKLLNGGIISCLIYDSLGNVTNSSFKQDSLITAPTCVTVTPNNTSCVSSTSLSWTTPDGCAAGYYVMLGTNGGGTNVPNNLIDSADIGNVTSYNLPFLNSGTTYYYKVIPYNNSHIPISGCAIGSFTSGNSVTYTPTLANPYQQNFDGVSAPTLPCGVTISDENFPIDEVSWKTNNGLSCSGNNSISIDKNPNNSNAKDDWFYSNPLNLSAGELYRVEFKEKVQSGKTESIETYISNGRDAATMLTTSSITNNVLTNTTCATVLGSDYIPNTNGIYAIGIHANSATNMGTISIDDLKVSLITTTHLTTASCGDSLNTCDTIHCIPYTGATSYKFKFEDLAISFSHEYTVTTANPKVYQFFGTNPIALGHTYSVSVSASTASGVWSPYGAACDVYINPVPARGLTGASCGGTLSDLSQLIYANTSGICQISDFKYQFTDQSTNTVIETQRNSATTSFLMTYITSPYVKYSTTYSVKVKFKIGNTWGDYGTACNVTTPASPLTKLTTTYCNYTLPTFGTPVSCASILGAQDYKYHITGPNNFNKTYTRNSSMTNWYFTWTTGMAASTTYDVEVASIAGGVWSAYGDVCTITTPASLTRLADTSSLSNNFNNGISGTINDSLSEQVSMIVYPNPNNFEQEFSIEFNGINKCNEKVQLSIFNMLGERVYRAEIISTEEKKIIIKPSIILNKGLYIIESMINGSMFRTKFIVD